jgi:hypothetical protein
MRAGVLCLHQQFMLQYINSSMKHRLHAVASLASSAQWWHARVVQSLSAAHTPGSNPHSSLLTCC